MIKKIIKNTRGITLTALIISISVIMILSGIILHNTSENLKIQKLKKLQSDIQTLREKISSYYMEFEDIPAKGEYTNTSYINSISIVDTGEFLVIDLSAMQNLTLNYGRDYEKIKKDVDFINSGKISNPEDYTDLYIINSVSHNIFYVKGVTIDAQTYYTDYTEGDKYPVIDYSNNSIEE